MMSETNKASWGGTRQGSGRKKGGGSGTRRVSFSVSCQPKELEALKAAAKEKGIPLSRLIVKSVLGEN